MKKLIASSLFVLATGIPAVAQHKLQVDNGPNKIGLMDVSSLPIGITILSWPSTGGTILTQSGGAISINGINYHFPASNGSGVLLNDGSGNLSWASGVPASGAAGGDLSGTFPNPTIASTAGNDIMTAINAGSGTINYSRLTGTPTSLPPSGAAGGDLTGTYPSPTINASIATGNDIAAALNLSTTLVNYSQITGGPTSLPPSGTAGGDLTGTYPNPTINASAATGNTIAAALNLSSTLINYSHITGGPTSLPPNGPAGGDLTGTYPNPTIAASAVTYAKIQKAVGNNVFLGNNAGANQPYSELSVATVQSMLGISSASSPTFTGLTISGLTAQPGVVHNSNAGVLSSSGIVAADIVNSNVTYAKIQNVTASRLLGNPTAGAAAPSEISLTAPLTFSGTSLSVPVMVASGASHASGLVPDPGATAGTTKFLREDGSWQVPAGGGGGTGVNFNFSGTGTQTASGSSAATLGNELFDVGYVNTGTGNAPGAIINATSKGNGNSATGLSVTADAASTNSTITGVTIKANSSNASTVSTGLSVQSSSTGGVASTGITVTTSSSSAGATAKGVVISVNYPTNSGASTLAGLAVAVTSSSSNTPNPAIVVGNGGGATGFVQYSSVLTTNNAGNNPTPADGYSVYEFTGTAPTGNVTLPSSSLTGKTVIVINSTGGGFTVNIAGGTHTVNQNRAAQFIYDGTSWFPMAN